MIFQHSFQLKLLPELHLHVQQEAQDNRGVFRLHAWAAAIVQTHGILSLLSLAHVRTSSTLLPSLTLLKHTSFLVVFLLSRLQCLICITTPQNILLFPSPASLFTLTSHRTPLYLSPAAFPLWRHLQLSSLRHLHWLSHNRFFRSHFLLDLFDVLLPEGSVSAFLPPVYFSNLATHRLAQLWLPAACSCRSSASLMDFFSHCSDIIYTVDLILKKVRTFNRRILLGSFPLPAPWDGLCLPLCPWATISAINVQSEGYVAKYISSFPLKFCPALSHT